MAGAIAATVLLSGGVDSAACAHHVQQQGFSVGALFVDYGQAARTYERDAATKIAKHLGIPLRAVGLSGLPPFGAGELLGRNAWLSTTAYFATSGAPGLICLGVHAGTPYHDCSKSFWDEMSSLVANQSDGKVRLHVPFVEWSKSDVWDYFAKSNIPLGHSYSCEAGALPPCGVCNSCHDRKVLEC